MAWTTTIVEKTKDARVLVRFTESGGFTSSAYIDPRVLDSEILAHISRLEALRAAPLGAYVAQAPSPSPPPPTPTPEQAALRDFGRRVRRYLVLRDILPANNQTLIDLRDSIITDLQTNPAWGDTL